MSDQSIQPRPEPSSSGPNLSDADSAFDSYVQQARNISSERGKDVADVMAILTAAGVSPEQIAFITSNPSLMDQIKRRPELAQTYAQRFPASGMVNTYETFAQQLGFGVSPEATFGYSGGADAAAMNALSNAPQTSEAGGIKFPNGVLVDPTTGQVVFPNDPEVQGSPQWLMKVGDWSEEKIENWRKTLKEAGYIESAKGGFTTDFVEALRSYHTNRYLYGNGKPVPMETQADRVSRDDFGAMLDRDVLKGEVRGWFNEVFGDDPSRRELDYWTDKLRGTALKVARKKGYEPGDAASVAQTRVQQEFLDAPSAETAIDNDYETTSLRDELMQAAQASDFLAFGR